MKRLLFITLLLAPMSLLAQTKIFATVYDEDNNPIARGLFKSAADSGIVILVDGMEVYVQATEITLIKIEKNNSKTTFIKIGVTAVEEAASYLVNRIGENSSSDSSGDGTTLQLETRNYLDEHLQSLFRTLLNGINDLALFTINNSQEKFQSKLRLLQQYSIDKETIAWANNETVNQFTVDEPTDTSMISNVDSANQVGTVIQNGTIKSQPGLTAPPKSKNITLIKGVYFVQKPARPIQIAISASPKSSVTPGVKTVQPTTNKQPDTQTKSSKPTVPSIQNSTNRNTQPIKVESTKISTPPSVTKPIAVKNKIIVKPATKKPVPTVITTSTKKAAIENCKNENIPFNNDSTKLLYI